MFDWCLIIFFSITFFFFLLGNSFSKLPMLMKQKQSKWKIIFITGSWILVKMELTWIAGGGVWSPLISCFPAFFLHFTGLTALYCPYNWMLSGRAQITLKPLFTDLTLQLAQSYNLWTVIWLNVDADPQKYNVPWVRGVLCLEQHCSGWSVFWECPGSGPCCISHSQHCLVSPGTSCLSSLLSPRLLCHPSMLQGHWHPASHDRLLHKQCDGGDVTAPHPTTLIVRCVLSRWYLTFEFKLTYYKLIWENKSNMPYAGDLAVDNLVQLQLRFFIACLSHPPGSCLHLSL